MIKVGDRLPAGMFRVKLADESVKEMTVDEIFKGKKVVFVGVPGAFTSTCHKAHIPMFVTHANEIKGHGVDAIVVMAVNDHHVMRAWAESQGGTEKLLFVADGDGDYARALGLTVSPPGLGTRVRRFSAVVDDGVVKTLNFEPEGSRAVEATSAAVILTQV
jgi:glutaredoxin/glutathione-dependent peroxiredoxin